MFVPYVNKNWPQIYIFYRLKSSFRLLDHLWIAKLLNVGHFFSFKLSQAISTEKESLVLVAEPILQLNLV